MVLRVEESVTWGTKNGDKNIQQSARLVGQVLRTTENDAGGYGFLLAKDTKPSRFMFLGRDCPEGELPETGALVEFSPSPTLFLIIF